MPHGGFAGTLAGDAFGQPRHIKGYQRYHVNYYYGLYRVTGEDGWIVAASKSCDIAEKEVKRLNRGGMKFWGWGSYDLDWAGRARELKDFLAREKPKKKKAKKK